MAIKKADVAKKPVRKTKEEVAEVYTDTLQGLQLQEETQLNSEKIVEAKKTKVAIETADALATENIAGNIQTLKSDIGQLLDKLADRLDQQIRRFADLQKETAARIEALQTLTQKQTEQMARLSQQHELAYEKVQSIALKALEGTTGSKAVAALQESLLEQSKRQAREEK